MRWVKFLLLFSILARQIVAAPTCPSGDEPTKQCDSAESCEQDYWCTELRKQNNVVVGGCCRSSFCRETGMTTIANRDSNGLILWKWDDLEMINKFRWYKTKITNSSVDGACPLPSAFQFDSLENLVMPVNFEIGGRKLVHCTTSGDCGLNEFCGQVYNPSFCEKKQGQTTFDCLDKSNGGKSVQFCYKVPMEDHIQIEIQLEKNKSGLYVCNSHDECASVFKGKSYCQNLGKSMLVIDEFGRASGDHKDGVCVIANVCSGKEFKSKEGSLGKNGQFCSLGDDKSCPLPNSKCISVSSIPNSYCCQLSSKEHVETNTSKKEGDQNEQFPMKYIFISIVVLALLVLGGYLSYKAVKWYKSDERDKKEELRNGKISNLIIKILDNGVEYEVIEFDGLKDYSPTGMTTEMFTRNSDLNRYDTVVCQDWNRIVLTMKGSRQSYIHANRLGTVRSPNRFICTQGPLAETCYDFWIMTIQEGGTIIIMLCKLIEKKKEKCSRYWPEIVGSSLTFENGENRIVVTNERTSTLSPDDQDVIITNLKIQFNEITKHVVHYNYVGWPDHGVPRNPKTVLNLLTATRKCTDPIIVHCSAGIGRTGSYAGMEFLLELLENVEEEVDIPTIFKQIRDQRPQSIQNHMQYLFIHRLILEFFLGFKKTFGYILEDEDMKKKLDKWKEDYKKKTKGN